MNEGDDRKEREREEEEKEISPFPEPFLPGNKRNVISNNGKKMNKLGQKGGVDGDVKSVADKKKRKLKGE